MAKIQTVEGSLVPQSGTPGAQLNMGQMLASGQGDVAFGRQIERTAGIAGAVASRLQAATNAADLAKAQQMMMKTSASFEDDMRTNQDETTWEEGWVAKSDQLRNELLSEDLAPDVRDRLEIELGDWQERQAAQVRGQATVRTIQRQKAKITLAADALYSAGDAEAGDAKIAEMGELGLIAPEEVDGLQTKGRHEAAMQTVNKMINDDPINAIDELEAKTKDGQWSLYKSEIDDNERLALLREAKVQTSNLRSETLNDIQDGINSGRIYGTAELQELVDQRLLKATQMKWIMDSQKRIGADGEYSNFASQLQQDLEAYDPNEDQTGEQRVELIGRIGRLTPLYQEFMKPILKSKINPSPGSVSTSTIRRQYQELLDSGAYGDTSKIPSLDKYRNPEAAARANDRYLKQLIEFDNFMRANPDASLEEQAAHYYKQTEVYRRDPTPVINSITSGRRK